MPYRPPDQSWFVVFRTLRSRLVFWNTLVVLIAVVVALYGVREGLRFYLTNEIESVLNEEAKVALLAIEAVYPDEAQTIVQLQRIADGHKASDWHIRWLDVKRSRTIWASGNAAESPLPQLLRAGPDYTVWTSESMMSVERKLKSSKLPEYYLRVGTPLTFVTKDVERLTAVLAPVGLMILLLAPMGGFLLAERAIDPLQNLIRLTERLRPSRMEERIPLRGVGDELDQLAYKINQFLDQIAEYIRRNRDFLANAAHELRSPLTAIMSSVEVTLQKSRSPEEYEELLYSIDDECRHLSLLVNQLLQLAESEAGVSQLGKTPVLLNEIVERTVEMFGPVAEERGVSLVSQCDSNVTAWGEERQLRQLVTNLVDNAIKFTSAGGTVTVRLRSLIEDLAELQVQDTGAGIPADDVPRIFERFYQVDRARRRGPEQRGNGLGLSICNAIIQNHSGTVKVASRLGEGTTITVILPETPPSEREGAPMVAVSSTAANADQRLPSG